MLVVQWERVPNLHEQQEQLQEEKNSIILFIVVE